MRQLIYVFAVAVCVMALLQPSAFAQERIISGTVSTEGNTPLPDVSVILVGTTTGTQTDAAGRFSIRASTGQVLEFSFVGLRQPACNGSRIKYHQCDTFFC